MGVVHRLVSVEPVFGIQAAGHLMLTVLAPWVQDLSLLVESVEAARPPGALPDWQPGAVLRLPFSKKICSDGQVVSSQALMALADAEDANVRMLAVNWCAELWPTADASGQRSAAEVMLRLSHDGSIEVERSAVLALGRIGDGRATDQLRHLLQRGPASVRAAAARACTRPA